VTGTGRAAAVLATIPGWAGASVRELPGGITNNAWLVDSGNARAVLKIDSAVRSAPFNTRRDEARVQTTAAAAGLANRVLHVGDTVYLTEYVPGTVWSHGDFDDDDKLWQLAAALRRLHSLPLTGRGFDASAAAHRYAGRLRDADPAVAARQVALIDAMSRPAEPCCCHNDLVAANILSIPGIRFLDWEYACDNDPLFDIATIVAHHRLSDRHADVLLDAYFDGDGARWRPQLALQQRLYDALLWLWSAARQ